MSRAGTIAAALRVALVASAMALVTAARGQSDVSVSAEAFGALHAYRPGDVTGVRVRLTSRLAEPVECLLQWDLENADGDLVSHERAVTLVPNQPVERWLYARTAPTSRITVAEDSVYTMRLFQTRDGERVRQLAERAFRPSETAERSIPVGLTQGAIAVIGSDRMGLETLEASLNGVDVPSMNELTRVVMGNRATDLPDRWEGLASFDTVVWRGDAPQSLGAERAKALRQWIERGGHLVIVLPETGDPWGLRGAAADHPLADLLPSKPAARVDGVPLESMLPLLSKGGDLRNRGTRLSMSLFSPSRLDRGWAPLLTTPGDVKPAEAQGLALVVQRSLEHGRITLIGLDLESLHRGAQLADGLPQADVFWNRVLGRRADAPSEDDYRRWEEAKKPTLLRQREGGATYAVGTGQAVLDAIGQRGRATAGVLAVMVFFGAYWMLAVPVCWALLRRRNRMRWSWPAFTAVAMAAIPVAWLIGSLIGGGSGGVRHLSVADWVLPAPGDDTGATGRLRVNAWLSASLGGFGTSEVRLGDEPSRSDLLLDWKPPPGDDGSRFPDTSRGARSVDRPTVLSCPSRETSTDLQAWWLGAAPASWKRVAWAQTQPETVVLPGASPRVSIRGTLRHELPGSLRDVKIVHVTPWQWESRRWSRANDPDQRRIEPSDLPSRPARMASLSSWDGSPLDLEKALYPQGPVAVGGRGDGALVSEIDRTYVTPLRNRANVLGPSAVAGPGEAVELPSQMEMLGLYQLLTPPEYRIAPGGSQASVAMRVQRMLGRELDLSAWSTRPCVIVTGFLDAAACPVPLRVDGDEPPSSGTVLVRLVFPVGGPAQGSVQPLSGNAVP